MSLVHELHQSNYTAVEVYEQTKINDLVVTNNTVLNAVRRHNSQSFPELWRIINTRDCQVNITCSPCSSIDINCIHLFSKSSSFFSSFTCDSESFAGTDCMNSLPGFLKIFSDLDLVFDAYPNLKL